MKRYFYAILVFIVFISTTVKAYPRTALVLSGGGARGLAQIGILKSLEEHGFKPDIIVATSMGSIIGALYAAGYSADSIACMTRSVDWSKIFINNSTRKTLFVNKKNELTKDLLEVRFDERFKPVVPNAISYGQAFYDYLAPYLVGPQFNSGSNFDSLSIPLRIIATDIVSGNKVVLSKGNLCTAIRASCAIPLAFTPIDIDGFLLVDGGISSNMPVETAIDEGAEFVIAIDVTSPPWKREDLSNPIKLVDQIVTVSSLHHRKNSIIRPDITITPELGSIKNTDFEMIDSLIGYGYRYAEEQWDNLAIALNSCDKARKAGRLASESDQFDSKEIKNKRLKSHDGVPVIRNIHISGNMKTTNSFIHVASGLKIGDTLSPVIVKKVISSLYATDLFNNVTIDIDTVGNCSILVNERLYYRVSMGARFDEFYRGEGYLEPAYENIFGNGSVILMHLQYGQRREKYTFELKGNAQFTRNIVGNMHLKLYSSKESILTIETMVSDSTTMVSTAVLRENTLRKIGSLLTAGTQLGRFSLLDFDMRLERFMIEKKDSEILDDLLGIKMANVVPYISFRLTMDSMDRYPFPQSGSKLFLSVGGATKIVGGKYSFVKFTGTAEKYITFCKYHTFNPKASFAFTDNSLPEVERAYIGGIVSEELFERVNVYNYIPFSGLPPRALMGDMYTIVHLEYRYEMRKHLFGCIMCDWGQAWYKKSYQYKDLAKNAPLGIGIGIAYKTIAGPIRLFYGHLIKNGKMDIASENDYFYYSAGYDF